MRNNHQKKQEHVLKQEQLKLTDGIMALPDLNANYWSNPKCGNTSFKHACLTASGETIADDPMDIYVGLHAVGIVEYTDKKTAMKNGRLNFTVIRHPIKRAISMYRDLAGKRAKKSIEGSPEFIRAWKYFGNSKHSFSEFVRLISDFSDKDRDYHFRSYTPKLLVGKKNRPIKNILPRRFSSSLK